VRSDAVGLLTALLEKTDHPLATVRALFHIAVAAPGLLASTRLVKTGIRGLFKHAA
jgi:hypothetical protein